MSSLLDYFPLYVWEEDQHVIHRFVVGEAISIYHDDFLLSSFL